VFGKSVTNYFCRNAEYNNYAILFFQIAFHPKFSSSRVEKERRAILSELQMMNTIEYRVDCQASELFYSVLVSIVLPIWDFV